MATNRQPAGAPGGTGGQWKSTPRAEESSVDADTLTLDSDSDGRPTDVFGLTTDFGVCPCGAGRLAQDDEPDPSAGDDEFGVECYAIHCSETGEMVGACDYYVDEETGEAMEGVATWFDGCSNMQQ